MSDISVVIPAYDQPEMLAQALRGVQRQTTPPLEVVVVDDCSPEPLEPRTEVPAGLPVRFVRHPVNTGPGGSVADGIREARGALIATLNHDDLWEPRFLERLAGALEAHPDASLAFCDHGIMGADTEPDEERSREHSRRFGRSELQSGVLRGSELCRTVIADKALAASSFVLARREVLDLALIEAGRDTWDYALGVGACRTADAAVFVAERLGWYRQSPTMLTTTWLDPRKQIDMAASQVTILLVVIGSPRLAEVRGLAARRLVHEVRHLLAAAVRTRSPRNLAKVLGGIGQGARDARRLSTPAGAPARATA